VTFRPLQHGDRYPRHERATDLDDSLKDS
jgi:hypothetical protein